MRVLDLAAEIDALRQEAAWRDFGYSARTLVDDPDQRTVLFAMTSGTRIQTDRASGASIRVLAGHLELHVGDDWDMLPFLIRHTEGACSFFSLYEHTIDLPVGSLFALDPRLTHDVEALEDSAFILHGLITT